MTDSPTHFPYWTGIRRIQAALGSFSTATEAAKVDWSSGTTNAFQAKPVELKINLRNDTTVCLLWKCLSLIYFQAHQLIQVFVVCMGDETDKFGSQPPLTNGRDHKMVLYFEWRHGQYLRHHYTNTVHIAPGQTEIAKYISRESATPCLT